MTAGRPARQLDWANAWLRSILQDGPRTVSDLKMLAQMGWRTVNQAKKDLSVQTTRIGNQWCWSLPGASGLNDANRTKVDNVTKLPIAPVPNSVPNDSPEDSLDEDILSFFNYEPDGTPYQTPAMITTARHLHLNKHQDAKKIIATVLENCRREPMTPPYPLEYIREVVYHVVEGKPIPPIPAGIEEDF